MQIDKKSVDEKNSCSCSAVTMQASLNVTEEAMVQQMHSSSKTHENKFFKFKSG